MTKLTDTNHHSEIYEVYRDILSKLPYSVVGYSNIDKKINDFFNTLSNNSHINCKENLIFISYSYAKLVDELGWETKTLSNKFFFHHYREWHSEIILAFYYYLKDLQLLENKTIDSQPTANILAGLFNRDTSYRVKFTTEDFPSFVYLQSKNLFEISIPLSEIIKVQNDNNQLETFKELIKELVIKIIDLSKNSDKKLYLEKDGSLYTKNKIEEIDAEILKSFKELFEKYFNEEQIKTFIESFSVTIFHFHIQNPGFFINNGNTKTLISNWIKTIIPVTFLSACFDCYVEYMPSVCGVFESKNENRNLGGMILGYEMDEEISFEDRSIFKILSDRITSVVASEFLFNRTKQLQHDLILNQYRDVLYSFKNTDLAKYSDILHGNSNGNISSEFVEELKKFFERNNVLLSDTFIKAFDKYVNGSLTEKKYLHHHYFTRFDNEKSDNVKEEIIIYKKLINDASTGLDAIDIPLICNFFELVSKNKKNTSEQNSVTIDCQRKASCSLIIANIGYVKGNEFDLLNLIKTMSDHIEDKDTSHELTRCIINNYSRFLAHGNMLIKDGSDNILIDLKNNLHYKNGKLGFLSYEDLVNKIGGPYKNLNFIVCVNDYKLKEKANGSTTSAKTTK